MRVVFTDDDWKFVESRFLRGPQYNDPHNRAHASELIRRKIERLVNFVFPRYAEMEKRHVSADQENKARGKVVADLKRISHIIEGWENIPGAVLFVALAELEVEREIEAPHEFLVADDNLTPVEYLRTVREQQPGEFDSLNFHSGTLLNLVKRYQRGVQRAELHRINQKVQGSRIVRAETRVYELFACYLAELWEDVTGSPPRISNNSGFMLVINHIYDLIERPNRGAASLEKDLKNYLRTRPTPKAIKPP